MGASSITSSIGFYRISAFELLSLVPKKKYINVEITIGSTSLRIKDEPTFEGEFLRRNYSLQLLSVWWKKRIKKKRQNHCLFGPKPFDTKNDFQGGKRDFFCFSHTLNNFLCHSSCYLLPLKRRTIVFKLNVAVGHFIYWQV